MLNPPALSGRCPRAGSLRTDWQLSLTLVLLCHIGDNSRMSTKRIAAHQWQKLYVYLPRLPRAYAGQKEKCCHFVDAVP